MVLARGWAETRSRAQALIRAGQVRRGTETLDKPGMPVAEDVELTLIQPPRFVSRGGEKLEGLLEACPDAAAVVPGARVLDVGASTGGFTDCVLQRGAVHVTALDVGHGQLHERLRRDPRVVSLEKRNARELAAGPLPHPDYDLVVMDLSFISLTKVLPVAWMRVRPAGVLAALVKPQFEATKVEADRARGVIRDPEIRARVRAGILAFAAAELPGAELLADLESPLKGGDGNVEHLLAWRKGAAGAGLGPA